MDADPPGYQPPLPESLVKPLQEVSAVQEEEDRCEAWKPFLSSLAGPCPAVCLGMQGALLFIGSGAIGHAVLIWLSPRHASSECAAMQYICGNVAEIQAVPAGTIPQESFCSPFQGVGYSSLDR